MISKPVFFASKNEVPDGVEIRDIYENSVRELFFVRHPKFKSMTDEASKHFSYFRQAFVFDDAYIYYPSHNICIRTVGEKYFFELRTARNRDLISAQEQLEYRNLKVGIIGLSIGSSALNCLVRTGGPKIIKIADPDTLETTNLNRLNANFLDIGSPKIDIATRNIYEVDPFSEVYHYRDGVNQENLEEFILGKPRLDCIIDALDNLEIKFRLRLLAKSYRVPVIMATDIGDNVVLDIERYDKEPDYQPFHGALYDISISELSAMPYRDWVRIATRIVDPLIMPQSILESIKKIGTTIAGVPQLGTTVAIAGSVTATAVRMIACDKELKSGRYIFHVDEILEVDLSRADKRDELRLLRNEVNSLIS